MRQRLRGFTIIATALVLSACQTTAPIRSTTAEEVGETWQLTQGVVKGKALQLVSGHEITLSFYANEAFVGRSAVNNYRVPVKISGSRIEQTGPVITTMMAGSMPAMQLESDYLSAISVVDKISRNGDKLRISGENIQLDYQRIETTEQ